MLGLRFGKNAMLVEHVPQVQQVRLVVCHKALAVIKSFMVTVSKSTVFKVITIVILPLP
jgi:hypothetical protein